MGMSNVTHFKSCWQMTIVGRQTYIAIRHSARTAMAEIGKLRTFVISKTALA
jgi:hypothetical protein